MTTVNDLVLIYLEDEPLTFARVEDISPDVKAGWYHVKLLILQVPLKSVTWILRDSYIDGTPYTMGGKKMKIERIAPSEEASLPEDNSETKNGSEKNTDNKSSNVVSFTEFRKKD